jgi:beta-phosphoglucomutase-like phosphatase (HAD superfamily)
MPRDAGEGGHKKQSVGAGVVFDLEYVAVPGRKILFDVLKNALAERDAELTPAIFSRCCLRPAPKQYVRLLLETLGKTRHSAERLADEVTEALKLSLSDGTVKLEPDAGTVIRAAREHGIGCGAVTVLEESAAEALMERLGLTELGVEMLAYTPEFQDIPDPRPWRRIVRMLGMQPHQCIALLSDAFACRSALRGGLSCIVRPDVYTSYQDFGGANAIVDRLDTTILDDLLAPAAG